MRDRILLLILIIGATMVLLVKLKRLLFRFYITLQGPFFAPTSDQRIKQILNLVKLKPGMKIVDLGCGDGRILIELVKAYPQITAVGVELDPQYIKLARENIKAAGLTKKITIKPANFWKENLGEYDLIVVYCIKRFMKKMEKKLKNEIKQSAQVVSVFFEFPTWKPQQKMDEIRLYRK